MAAEPNNLFTVPIDKSQTHFRTCSALCLTFKVTTGNSGIRGGCIPYHKIEFPNESSPVDQGKVNAKVPNAV